MSIVKDLTKRRLTKKLTFKGQTAPASSWAAEIGIPLRLIHQRLRNGWTVERTLCEPIKRK
jgi:hypothetical protein